MAVMQSSSPQELIKFSPKGGQPSLFRIVAYHLACNLLQCCLQKKTSQSEASHSSPLGLPSDVHPVPMITCFNLHIQCVAKSPIWVHSMDGFTGESGADANLCHKIYGSFSPQKKSSHSGVHVHVHGHVLSSFSYFFIADRPFFFTSSKKSW